MPELIRGRLHNQARADRFIGTIAGTVPLPAFFGWENLERIMPGAPATAG